MIKHSEYWFEDGSVLIIVQGTVYKLYRSLINRLSPSFFDRCCEMASAPEAVFAGPIRSEQCFVVRPDKKVSEANFDILIGHILHDITLTDEVPFSHVSQLYIISSESRLGFKKVHSAAERQLSAFMQRNPLDLDFSDYKLLEDAFDVSSKSGNSQLESLLKRALYYTYATHDDVTFGDTSAPESNPASKHITGPDAIICERVMSHLSEQFSPTLFQPPAALHMECTDVYASLWMERAVQPAFAENGLANPTKTLRRLRSLDWKREGEGVEGERIEPCNTCSEHMRQQWSDEALAIWEMMDGWLDC